MSHIDIYRLQKNHSSRLRGTCEDAEIKAYELN